MYADIDGSVIIIIIFFFNNNNKNKIWKKKIPFLPKILKAKKQIMEKKR